VIASTAAANGEFGFAEFIEADTGIVEFGWLVWTETWLKPIRRV
jgi:hypothetical protein